MFVSNQAFGPTFRADQGSRNRRRSASFFSAATAGEGVSQCDEGKKKCLQSPVDGSSGQSMSTGTAEGSASVNTGYMWFLPLYSSVLFFQYSASHSIKPTFSQAPLFEHKHVFRFHQLPPGKGPRLVSLKRPPGLRWSPPFHPGSPCDTELTLGDVTQGTFTSWYHF